MKKFLALLLVILMCIPTVAYAEDIPEYKVKYLCTDFRDVVDQIAHEVAGEGEIAYVSNPGAIFTKSVILQVDDKQVRLTPVFPKYSDVTVPSIMANDVRNASYTSLDMYIKDNISLTQISTEYDSAYGTAPIPQYTVSSTRQQYVPTGTTYKVELTYEGGPSYVSLTVTGVDGSAPSVSIYGQGLVSCNPSNVEFSEDQKTWTGIRDGQPINSRYYGRYLYFRTPASGVYAASSSVRLYVKETQSPPTAKLELTSNSYSITITNADQFKGCRFSIDDRYYTNSSTITGLQPNTRYTVYVKYPEDQYYFESAAATATITTTEAAVNNIKYTSVSTSDTIYYQATGTAAISVSGKTLSSAYTNATVSALKNDITKASKKTDVVTTLDVLMEQEDSDNREYNTITFSMPSGMGLLRLNLVTPWFTVMRTTETTSVRLQEGTAITNKDITEWKSGKSHVYTVNINNNSAKAGETIIIFPWTWPDRADLDGLEVGYCSRDGKVQKTLNYSVTTNGVQFTIPDNGYFYIRNLNRPYGKLPFLDSQTSWAYSFIYHAYETGLVAGTSATTFSPDGVLTRAEVCTLLARMAGADLSKSYGEMEYTDVAEGDWYYNPVSYIYSLGVMPKSITEFGPHESITRAEMCALTNALFPYEGVLWTPFNCTDRDDIPTYALRAVDGYYTCGVINGTSPTTFSPSGNLTRAEAVTILYRLQTLDFWR